MFRQLYGSVLTEFDETIHRFLETADEPDFLETVPKEIVK